LIVSGVVMKNIFLFIFFLTAFVSCGEDKKNSCDNSESSIDNCVCENCSENELCYKGICINTSSECEKDQVLALCSDNANYYCKLNSENIYECVPFDCSYSKPNGVCENGKTCSNGECI